MSGYKKINAKIVHNDFIFLKENGLKPNHNVLDIGCGGGRLGNNLISYLDDNKYYGFDKEKNMIDFFNQNLTKELKKKSPYIIQCDFNMKFLENHNVKFDYIYAYSVFTHNPKEKLIDFLMRTKIYMNKGCKFYMSMLVGKLYFVGYAHKVRKNEYNGVWYSIKDLDDVAKKCGYNVKFIGDESYNWEKVRRDLYDERISLSHAKYNKDTFSPFTTQLCKKNKCKGSPHTHGSHQEMFLFTLI